MKKFNLTFLFVFLASMAFAQMGHENPIKASIIENIDGQFEELRDLSDRIWSYEEIAFQEFQSSRDLAAHAEANGFKVTKNIGEIPTAFTAEFGSGSPVIGILGEFDALPGLSQKTVPHKDPLNKGGAGHGCGHNLFGVASLGAAIAIKNEIEAGNLSGTIRFYGTPAEEKFFGKLWMIRSGAFDSLGVERWVLMASLDDALKAAEQSASNRDSGIDDLFGEVVPGPASSGGDVYADFRRVRPWTGKERLGGEKDTLGLYVTGHPIDEYESEVRKFAPTRIADLRADKSGSQVLAGLVVSTRTMKTKRGDTMAFLQLDDRSARIEVTVYGETYNAHRDLLSKDSIVIIEGSVSHDDYTGGLAVRAKELRTLLQARQNYS